MDGILHKFNSCGKTPAGRSEVPREATRIPSKVGRRHRRQGDRCPGQLPLEAAVKRREQQNLQVLSTSQSGAVERERFWILHSR